MKLKKVGTAGSESFPHALYLMSKYCKEKDKVKYYTIQISALNEEIGRGRQVIVFWRK